MNTRKLIKRTIILSISSLLVIFVFLYFSISILPKEDPKFFNKFLLTFILPLGSFSLIIFLILSYFYLFNYKIFLKKYEEMYENIIAKALSQDKNRKYSLLEDLIKGAEKDPNGRIKIIESEDEFGEIGHLINLILPLIYEQDIEKSKLLAFQKEVINKLLSFIDEPVVILRLITKGRKIVIVSNLNESFLNALKTENLVKLAKKLMDTLKLKEREDLYLYNLIFDIIRSENLKEDLKEIFIGQELGVEEFLVEFDKFFTPFDERSKNIVKFITEVIKGSEITEIDRDISLECLDYKSYRESYILPEVVESLLGPVAPDDELTFLKKQQDLLYKQGIEIKNFNFILFPKEIKNSPKSNILEKEVVFNSSFTIIPATNKRFSNEKMLVMKFSEIKVLN